VRIFLIGTAIESLAETLGDDRVAGHARRIEDLMEPMLQSLAFGDAVMVKGSKGVRLALLVDRIKQRFGVSA
jgi:UDP-N-acetylmuramoyl-tripeptide--D-alanyl-D-alanine ligase